MKKKGLKSLLLPFGFGFCARGKALFTMLALFFFINALGTLDATQAQTKSFTITSGPMGGDWYSIGGAMGEIAKKIFPGTVVTVTTGGAVANLAMVNTGKADVGLSMAKLYGEALTGKGEYEGKRMPNLRAISFLANIPMSFFLVKADNPIQSIEEIKNKKIRILTAPKGSSPSLAAELMLKGYGITFDDIKKGGGLRQLCFLRRSLEFDKRRPCRCFYWTDGFRHHGAYHNGKNENAPDQGIRFGQT